VKSTFSPEDQAIIKLLKALQPAQADYPRKLLARRRAAFIKQIARLEKPGDNHVLPLPDRKTIKLLEGLRSDQAEYPPDLFARRRAAFISQIVEREGVEAVEELPLPNQDVIGLLGRLKPITAEYPQQLMAKRRAAFVRQVARRGQGTWWERLLSDIQNRFIGLTISPGPSPIGLMRTSLVLVSLVAAAYLGSLILGTRAGGPGTINGDSAGPAETSEAFLPTPTATLELAKTICKPGYKPPMCLAAGFDKSRDLTFRGNGLARAAVAKDTVPGYSGIHQAAYVNDGLYGSGASWVSYSANSWIKIDLGQNTTINIVEFGKDRLGNFRNHNPGQFTIEVALSDNVYANGDSTNDDREYKQVFDSKTVGFTGEVAGAETIKATFNPTLARFVKITVTNPGAAIDEVEIFYSSASSPSVEIGRTREPRVSQPTSTVTPSPTSRPTNTRTPIPTRTRTPIPTNTRTPIPTDTPTLVPTDTLTPMPTDTATPMPMDTPTPAPTDVPILVPTDTETPVPTDTLTPVPVV